PKLGKKDLQDALGTIKRFLEENPVEIITLIFESYISLEQLGNELNTAELKVFLYCKNEELWATITEMCRLNQRLIIFTDTKDKQNTHSWNHYLWTNAVETSYSVRKQKDFTMNTNRGKIENELFILNHFLIRRIGT